MECVCHDFLIYPTELWINKSCKHENSALRATKFLNAISKSSKQANKQTSKQQTSKQLDLTLLNKRFDQNLISRRTFYRNWKTRGKLK